MFTVNISEESLSFKRATNHQGAIAIVLVVIAVDDLDETILSRDVQNRVGFCTTLGKEQEVGGGGERKLNLPPLPCQ